MSSVASPAEARGGGGGGIRRGPWEPIATLAFSLLIFGVNTFSQLLGMVPGVLVLMGLGVPWRQVQPFAMSGFNLSIAVCVACPLTLFTCALIAWTRRGPSLGDYLAIRAVSPWSILGWMLLMAGVGFGLSYANEAVGRETPKFMTMIYESAGYLPLLWVAIGIVGPVTEEVYMRGFLFAGLEQGALGRAGTVLLTSLIFSLIHVGQYDWVEVVQVGILGICFGTARAVTGSLLPPIFMHCLHNLLGTMMMGLEEQGW